MNFCVRICLNPNFVQNKLVKEINPAAVLKDRLEGHVTEWLYTNYLSFLVFLADADSYRDLEGKLNAVLT